MDTTVVERLATRRGVILTLVALPIGLIAGYLAPFLAGLVPSGHDDQISDPSATAAVFGRAIGPLTAVAGLLLAIPAALLAARARESVPLRAALIAAAFGFGPPFLVGILFSGLGAFGIATAIGFWSAVLGAVGALVVALVDGGTMLPRLLRAEDVEQDRQEREARRERMQRAAKDAAAQDVAPGEGSALDAPEPTSEAPEPDDPDPAGRHDRTD